MTTHVLIVDQNTFKIHLEYMFAGTGAKDKDVDFNDTVSTSLHPATEKLLVAMMADGSRVRKGDHIVFYVQATSKQEGKFYGIFKAKADGIFLERFVAKSPQYLYKQLGKNLTFRFEIEPEEVYSKGVTEWQALNEIRNICSPNQMLWSLIYRKLRANRGNTMITMYEADRLFGLIRQVNKNVQLKASSYIFNSNSWEIEAGTLNNKYKGQTSVPINILPRLAQKYVQKEKHEVHLQQYIVQHLGKGGSLDNCLNLNGDKIEWIGNEVACGVGMQRIDIMVSVKESEIKRILFPIELKAVEVQKEIVKQLDRYIDWIEQYYISNLQSIIQPILICKDNGLKTVSTEVQASFNDFNSRGNISGYQRYRPLIFIQYVVNNKPNSTIHFNTISY